MEMTRRTGVDVDPSHESTTGTDNPDADVPPKPVQPPERYVVDDALWVIPSSNYVDPGPPLETSLFDDRNRLDDAWRLAMRTLQAETEESDERRQEIAKEAQKLIDEAERSALSAMRQPPDHSAQDAPILSPTVVTAPIRGRIDRMVRATRRLVLRHG
ncbi:hypothetical protein ACPXCJ_07890 [Micromonospora chalcea]|uniref:hypothetical protein n=1 Tax=Micromonospora chalcea TaxID=1874 RepID=UPI003CEF4E66